MKQSFLLVAACWCLLGLHSQAAPAADKPNVLFIGIDDLRTTLGCYGDPIAKSPNIDALAKSGRLFNRAYCQQAVCGATRTSLLTGLLPDHTRVWNNRTMFRQNRPELTTLPQYFKNNGYFAQCMGKMLSGENEPEMWDPQSWSVPPILSEKGWKKYALPKNGGAGKQAPMEFANVPDEGYPDGQLAKLAVQTLGTLKAKNQPFFLAVGFFKPHLPFNAPKKYWDLYEASAFKDIPLRPRAVGAPDAAYPDHLELGGYKDVPDNEKVQAAQAAELRHGYYACVTYTDAQIGKVLDELKRLGLDQNTIVVLWGDHGWSLGEADHWCKDTNFESDARVPLIVRTPGMARAGVATDAITEYLDVYPTLTEAAGLPAAKGLDGQSVVPILNDPKQAGHAYALSQFPRPFSAAPPKVMGYSVRTMTHRYTRWVEWPARTTQFEELYDYTSATSVFSSNGQFFEAKSLIDDPGQSAVRDELRKKLDDVLATRIGALPPEATTPSDAPAAKKKKKKSAKGAEE